MNASNSGVPSKATIVLRIKRQDRPDSFRVVGGLGGADEIMHRALFLGTYPGLTREMLDYEIGVIQQFVRRH